MSKHFSWSFKPFNSKVRCLNRRTPEKSTVPSNRIGLLTPWMDRSQVRKRQGLVCSLLSLARRSPPLIQLRPTHSLPIFFAIQFHAFFSGQVLQYVVITLLCHCHISLCVILPSHADLEPHILQGFNPSLFVAGLAFEHVNVDARPRYVL